MARNANELLGDYRNLLIHWIPLHTIAATQAEKGIVKIQASIIERAIPHRTADKRRVEPTPMMAPVMVWVVETGMPPREAPINVAAPANSAQAPPTGFNLVMRMESVLMIRQPPARVPKPMAA